MKGPGRARRIAVSVLPPVVFLAALIGAWEAAASAGLLSPIRFPAPSRIARSLVELIVEGFPIGTLLARHTLVTLRRIASGFALAMLLAVPLGLVIGRSQVLTAVTAPIVTFCRSVATLSLLPLALVWFGTGEATKTFLIGYGCFWVMLSNVVAAMRLVDPVLVRAALTLDTRPRDIFLRVALPAALPRILSGARIALGVGFMVIVGAEMIGTTEGLGALIMEARTFYRSDITMVGMLVIGVIGLALSLALARLEAWLTPWRAREERRG